MTTGRARSDGSALMAASASRPVRAGEVEVHQDDCRADRGAVRAEQEPQAGVPGGRAADLGRDAQPPDHLADGVEVLVGILDHQDDRRRPVHAVAHGFPSSPERVK